MGRIADRRIAFIGGGNMATALVRGLLEAERDPSTIVVSEPLAARRRAIKRRYGVATTSSNEQAVADADIVVLSVKPQVVFEVIEALRAAVTPSHLVISIAAGVPLARLEAAFGGGIRVVRVMPNTPSLVGRGAAVACAGASVRRQDLAAVVKIFQAVGAAHYVVDEALLDAVTGLSGSGPAYVYRFAEALIEAGQRCGLPEKLATDLAYETIAGAAEMLIRTGERPAALREAVSSPGGTTLAGLAALEEEGFFAAVVAGVRAATRRSEELGRR